MPPAENSAPWSAVQALLSQGVGSVYPAAGLLVQRGRQTLFAQAVGTADLSTWFDVASLTKALCTSLLCMRAVAAGQLRLDDTALPGMPIESLLRHASGLPAWLPLFSATPPPSRTAMIAGARAAARDVAAVAAVEKRAVYSDLGFILLADQLEQRLGERLDVAFHRVAHGLSAELTFRPLDLPEAQQRVPAVHCAPTRRETPAREPLQGVVHDDNARAMLGVSGHAGLFGTLHGVATIAAALLDCYHGCDTPAAATLALPSALVQQFWALPNALPNALADAHPTAGQAPGSTWGLGWDHPSPPPAPSPTAAAPAAPSAAGSLWPRSGVGHLGFTGCSLWLDPGPTREQSIVAVFLSNRVCVATPEAAAATQAAIKALRPKLHDALYRAATPPIRD